jgi:N-acetyl-1-D-myo-inositol-2-amino-2-deoxy-alpha-D-glucopyranoside deacetylase
VESLGPTVVVYPDGEDDNADHWAVNALVQDALARKAYGGRRITYLVHRGHFPFPWSRVPKGTIMPPRDVRSLGTEWLSYPLTKDEQGRKERALDAYASQRAVMAPFLAAFVRRNELFGEVRIPTVPLQGGTPAALDASSMPGAVLTDPTGDTLLRKLDPGVDIRQVAVVRDGDGLHLGIETRAAPPRIARYTIDLRIFVAGGERRVDVATDQHGATVRRADVTGTAETTAAPVLRSGKRMWVSLPASLFEGSSAAMVGAGSFVGDQPADRTAWRTFSLR